MNNMANWQGTQSPSIKYETGAILKRQKDIEGRSVERQGVHDMRKIERVKNALMSSLGP